MKKTPLFVVQSNRVVLWDLFHYLWFVELVLQFQQVPYSRRIVR